MALAAEMAAATGAASPMLSDYLDQFERSGADMLILSSESFAARLRGIREQTVIPLNAFEVDLVLFTRRADAFAVSSFKHLVRRDRYTGSFSNFVADSERKRTRNQAMNLAPTMNAAKRLFPEAMFRLHDLDTDGPDTIALFAALTGLPLTEWSNEPRPENKSRNAQLMRTGRAVNQSHSDEKTLYLLACNRSSLGDQAVSAIDRALILIPDADPEPRQLLSGAESERLLLASLAHNRSVELEFGIPLARYSPMTIPERPRTGLTLDETDRITQGLAPYLPPWLYDCLRRLLLKS